MITQKDKILKKLNESGMIDNFWAIRNGVLRLGARIHDLKREGFLFTEKYGEGTNRKNFYYFLIKQ